MTIQDLHQFEITYKPNIDQFLKFNGRLMDGKNVTIYLNRSFTEIYCEYRNDWFVLTQNKVTRLSATFNQQQKILFDKTREERTKSWRNNYYREYNRKFKDRRKEYSKRWHEKNPHHLPNSLMIAWVKRVMKKLA